MLIQVKMVQENLVTQNYQGSQLHNKYVNLQIMGKKWNANALVLDVNSSKSGVANIVTRNYQG